MLARSSLVVLVLLPAGCLKDLTQIETGTGSLTETTTDTTDPTETTATSPATTDVEAECGNGKLEPGEQCDDGNKDPGDGCEPNCTTTPGELCGNGTKDEGEDCDDGNNDDGDGCEGNCRLPVTVECGDGKLDPGEQCDDGNKMSGDGCESNCTNTPVCGDGMQDPGEQCDDGNEMDDDGCLSTCVMAKCGDGILWADQEMCDDGPMNGMYGQCNSECSGPGERCGDGTRNGPEECDDANQMDDDECSNTCIAPRLVFVTAAGFTGNLGGLVGADAKCKQTASNSSLPTNLSWTAWLSDGTDSPSSAGRMETDYAGYYKLANAQILAHGWSALVAPPLALPIDIDENGNPVEEPLLAWSNTSSSGESAGTANCNNWTSPMFSTKGRFGDVSATDATWTDDDAADNPTACSNSFHLYCFQNAPRPEPRTTRSTAALRSQGGRGDR
ncbi:DUF4215 domain-containing protein [Nannocystis pusilla]|uniref:DUF4215 domain-containing protein n=1 Tax=Nannocystis pusilla TaxID=889268 RepID=A0A9X3IY51_9BACT|nr:DUF4215 domain-containing protein [Nannocystis pusilla]MCY1009147.1 DUF4215 domain-containing protein [Nannocystis pusilla]